MGEEAWRAIWQALWIGVKVTWWIFKKIFSGYFVVLRWLDARNQGIYYPFPIVEFSISVILTIALVWYWIILHSHSSSLSPSLAETSQSKVAAESQVPAPTPTALPVVFSVAVDKETVKPGDPLTIRVEMDGTGYREIEYYGFHLTWSSKTKVYLPEYQEVRQKFIENSDVESSKSIMLSQQSKTMYSGDLYCSIDRCFVSADSLKLEFACRDEHFCFFPQESWLVATITFQTPVTATGIVRFGFEKDSYVTAYHKSTSGISGSKNYYLDQSQFHSVIVKFE